MYNSSIDYNQRINKSNKYFKTNQINMQKDIKY